MLSYRETIYTLPGKSSIYIYHAKLTSCNSEIINLYTIRIIDNISAHPSDDTSFGYDHPSPEDFSNN
jgi:hypothetical protein